MKTLKFFIGIDRVVVWAVAISLAWHLFWVFGVRVVVAPKTAGTVKISKVSYAGSGPGHERGALVLKASGQGRSYLEGRYFSSVCREVPLSCGRPECAGAASAAEKDLFAWSEKSMADKTRVALSSSKLEPEFGMD